MNKIGIPDNDLGIILAIILIPRLHTTIDVFTFPPCNLGAMKPKPKKEGW